METIVGLSKKIAYHRQEMGRINLSIIHLENEKKTTYLKDHMGELFLNDDFYIKPLKMQDKAIIALTIGDYDGLPFMEMGNIDIQNLYINHPLGHKVPKEELKIKRDIEMYLAATVSKPIVTRMLSIHL